MRFFIGRHVGVVSREYRAPRAFSFFGWLVLTGIMLAAVVLLIARAL